jgi:hypothetical protein
VLSVLWLRRYVHAPQCSPKATPGRYETAGRGPNQRLYLEVYIVLCGGGPPGSQPPNMKSHSPRDHYLGPGRPLSVILGDILGDTRTFSVVFFETLTRADSGTRGA